jgi:hypothetical protein
MVEWRPMAYRLETPSIVIDWIARLLEGRSATRVCDADLISHLRATIAYLEVNRDEIKKRSLWSWPFNKKPPTLQPLDAEFKEVSEPTDSAAKKPGKSVRVIK